MIHFSLKEFVFGLILHSSLAQNGSPFSEEWRLPTSEAFITYVNADHGSINSGYIDSTAEDGFSLKLTLNPNLPPGVGGAPASETKAKYKYGSYWTRVKTANCSNQPLAGVVTGIFTFFNDGGDRNGNDISDNSEIDFEWLCAKPEVVHLSIWTDYQDNVEPARLRSTYRTMNLRTGEILTECYKTGFDSCEPLTDESERQPTTFTPITGYDSSTQYYNYGLIFEEDRVRFLIEVDGENRTLWDYQGPNSRIPKDTVYFMQNVWHTNNWWPEDNDGSAIESPKSIVNAFVDSTRFQPAM